MITPGKDPPVLAVPVEEEAGDFGHGKLGTRRTRLGEGCARKGFIPKINHSDIEVVFSLAGKNNCVSALWEIQGIFGKEDQIVALVINQNETNT